MTGGKSGDTEPLITLVLRMWPGGAYRHSEDVRLQATHVQTGEVAYFRTIEGVAHHIERLAQSLIRPPIDLSEARRRSNNSNG